MSPIAMAIWHRSVIANEFAIKYPLNIVGRYTVQSIVFIIVIIIINSDSIFRLQGPWNHKTDRQTDKTGPTNDSRHWRHQGNNIPDPAAVGGSPTGKCGLLPQHFHHRVNAVVVLLAQSLLSLTENGGAKIIIIVITDNRRFQRTIFTDGPALAPCTMLNVNTCTSRWRL